MAALATSVVPTPAPIVAFTPVAPGQTREVVKCEPHNHGCGLVQFRTESDKCRRCKRSLTPPPKALPVSVVDPTPISNVKEDVLMSTTCLKNLPRTLRDLRDLRHLSQRQLAERMIVPRTYISKLENGKASPTLSSLSKIAGALGVTVHAILECAEESSVSSVFKEKVTDPFLLELAQYLPHLNSTQRSIVVNQARELASQQTHKQAA